MTEFIRGFRGEYQFMSNFMYVPVEYDGVIYPTNEHAFQAAKFADREYRAVIKAAKSPEEAKSLGKTRKYPLRDGWDDGLAVQVMSYINAQKFRKPKYRDLLLDTGEAILVETNRWNDDIWGDSTNTSTPGRNQLGIILMAIREALQAEEDEYLAEG